MAKVDWPNFILCVIGVGIFYLLWKYDVLPFSIIKTILTEAL